jgi:hypothetical protein
MDSKTDSHATQPVLGIADIATRRQAPATSAARTTPAPSEPPKPKAKRRRATPKAAPADLAASLAAAEERINELTAIIDDITDLARDALWHDAMIAPRIIADILTR